MSSPSFTVPPFLKPQRTLRRAKALFFLCACLGGFLAYAVLMRKEELRAPSWLSSPQTRELSSNIAFRVHAHRAALETADVTSLAALTSDDALLTVNREGSEVASRGPVAMRAAWEQFFRAARSRTILVEERNLEDDRAELLLRLRTAEGREEEWMDELSFADDGLIAQEHLTRRIVAELQEPNASSSSQTPSQ
jgi:hypothetical protein